MWWLLAVLTILPFEVAARYPDYGDYDDYGDASSLLLILVPVCVMSGYMLGNEIRSFRDALKGVIAIAVMLAITAALSSREVVEIVAGATAFAGLVGLVRRKSS